MKYAAVLFSVLLFTGSAFAGILPGDSKTGDNLLPGTDSQGNVLPGGSSGGGNVLPGGSSGGGNVLPSPSSKTGGGDFFVSATRLTEAIASDTGNNLKATLETGEPVHGGYTGNPGGKSLWWSWRSTVTGVLVVSTAGSAIDTVVGVYTGDSVSSLTRVGSDNDSGPNATSLVTVPVVSGLTYYIAVDGYNGAAGNITLSLNAQAYSITSDGRPSNDDFATAELLSGNYATAVGFNDYATPESGDFWSLSNGQNRSIWWNWTAPATGLVTITTDGSSFDTLLAVAIADGDSIDDIITFNVDGDLDFEADDDGGNTTRSSKVQFRATKGVTYHISVDGFPYGESAATGTTLLDLSLVPIADRPGNDEFEYRTGIQGENYTVTTTNDKATYSENEPIHGDSLNERTVWWTWTAPAEIGTITLTANAVANSPIQPVIAVYTGVAMDSLIPVASATDADSDGQTTLTVDTTPGVIYQIVVTGGSLGSVGGFNFTLAYADGGPAFASQPVSQTAVVGADVVFSAPAASTTVTPYFYQWQIKIGSVWTNLVNDATYSIDSIAGTLTVNNVTLANTNSRFRCLLYNIVGSAPSSEVTLVIVPNAPTDQGASLDIKVGTLVNRTIAVVDSNFAIKYYALGLPKGLTLNASTGQITGTVTAAAGSYTVTYWTQAGNLKSAVLTTVIVVPPYPSVLTGDFEALLTNGSDLPVGKLQITIGSTGLYTGKLTTAAAAVNTLKGSMIVSLLDDSATSTFAIKRKGAANSTLSFTVNNDGTIDATLVAGVTTEGTAVNGVKVATSSINWAGTYTLAFSAPTLINLSDTRFIPGGSGYASVKIASSGVMTITGKNADGTPLTASLASDAAASYRLYAKPNTNLGSYVAGWLVMSTSSPGVYHADVLNNQDLYWNLAASTKNTAYKDGFGPLALTARMEPWANLFAPYQVQLAEDGLFGVDIFGAGITNGGLNTNNLPTALQLALGGQIGLTTPNLSGWSISVNTATGVFTGSFTVTDTLTRQVPFSGVMLQLPDSGVFGQGYFLLPSTAKKGPSLSGGMEFIAP
ncbi:MAG TPA: putative Ig domain-containing protein [Roseimicrobium sp.]|nr:putative Ig domain-containing protein [Roseimicrobium sp.]